jgi:transcriptional regulator with XRE-family HTH domain
MVKAAELAEEDVYATIVGAVIKRRRESLLRPLSQRGLALESRVPQSTLSRIERGMALPDAYSTRLLGEVFGLSAAELQAEFDEAFEATQQWAEQLPGENSTGTWWGPLLAGAAVGALAAVAAVVVANLRGDD